MSKIAMSQKTLNKSNLIELGPNKLAELLLEVSTGSSDIKRRLRLELSFQISPNELGKDVRKRLVAIRKSKSYAGWRKRKSLVKDLQTQVDMICNKVAVDNPTLGLELLWEFIALAPSVYERVDDSRGEVAAVFGAALVRLSAIAPLAVVDPNALATQVWCALQDNLYGEFDGLIALMAPTLGDEGLTHLKQSVVTYQNNPEIDEGEDHAALIFLRSLRGEDSQPNTRKIRLVQTWLQDIAQAQGDAETYIAQYTAQDLLLPGVAAEIAQIWLEAERQDEALALLEATDLDAAPEGIDAWDTAYIRCLSELGRIEDAQSHCWLRFEQSLNVLHLRRYLKPLPDFDDVEVEDRAKEYALRFPHFDTALAFFLEWPDLLFAARLITTRTNDINGSFDRYLTPAVDALRERHPLAATIVLRAMVTDTLERRLVARYGDAAEHLKDCAALDAKIENYDKFQTHQTFSEQLEVQYDIKMVF
tara:strand:+ start:1213 stop:2640 length:1428 start_codon:yes stop_codon:yes gene_type:complete